MKILGKTTKGYILDASTEELANLLSKPHYASPPIDIGDEIDIHNKTKDFEYFLSKENDIQSIADQLNNICTLIWKNN